ncbi:hypothetical protein D1007_36595 [Hordeum vulgare]|nr:hypothetical protein D1007_36595 [Hordeum vulgare]
MVIRIFYRSGAATSSHARGCGVDRSHVYVEVMHPVHFFITFGSKEIYDRVFASSARFRCSGDPAGFRRWHRSVLASSDRLDFFCKMSIYGLSTDAWECDAVGQLLNNLGGQLVEILPTDDRWLLDVIVWLHNPSDVPKLYDLEVSEPVGKPISLTKTFLSCQMPRRPRLTGAPSSMTLPCTCSMWWT